MIKGTKWFWAAAIAMVASGGPAFAQQGEGTGGDFHIATGVNGSAPSENDKYLCEMDVVQVDYVSPNGTHGGAGLMLLADVAPVSFDISEIGGVIGTGINRFVIADGITQPGPALPPIPGAPFTQNFVVPTSSVWDDGGGFNTNGLQADDWGIFLQAFVTSPDGLFGLVHVSNTVKHEVDTTCLWAETCGEAVAAALAGIGLDDSDLGVSQTVNTALFANDTSLEVFGPLGDFFSTFIVEGPNISNRANSEDAFTVFTATEGGLYTFSTCNSDYDTSLYLIGLDCTTPIGHNEDSAACYDGVTAQTGYRAQLTVALFPGQQVIVGVDGYSTGSFGVADLVITADQTPVVTSQDVPSVDLTGGSVVLSGANLQGIVAVTVGGVAATNVVASFDTVAFDAPATPGGVAVADVSIVISDGVNSYAVALLDYVDLSVSPLFDCHFPGTVFGGPGDASTTAFDVINLTGAPGSTVSDVTVNVDFSHAWRGDLDLDLTSPDGTVVRLYDGDVDNDSDDDVLGNFPTTLPVDGPGSLLDFVGESAEGNWTLFATDTFSGADSGTFNGWCITVMPQLATAPLTVTQSPALFIPSVMTVSDSMMVTDNVIVGSVSVDVDISHSYSGDLVIELVSPIGTIVRLRNESGGSSDDVIGNFPSTLAVSGPGSLADFGGETSAGLWELVISDLYLGDQGTLNAWGLNFN